MMLALFAPGLWLCTDGPATAAGGNGTTLASLLLASATGQQARDSAQLVVRRVWSGRGVDALGQPTPDGRYLTFMDWSTGNLAVRDMSTGEARHLTRKPTNDAGYGELSVVSPDGKRVAYHWYPGAWTWELRVVNLDGTNDRLLLRDEEGQQIYAAPRDWSPDGREILVSLTRGRGESARSSIVLVSVADGSLRVLKDTGSRSAGGERFSPDGRYVVYQVEADEDTGQRDIFLLPVHGGGETALIEHPADDFVLGWVPDSEYVLFASDRTGTLGAWVVPVVDGKSAGPPTLVKPDLWRAFPMGFTADGAFYYGVHVSTRGVHLATIDPETWRPLTAPTPVDPRQLGSSQRPRWSPDGRYLAYLTTTGNSRRRVVTIRSMDTGETRELDPRSSSCPPRWSPDGRHFLFCGGDEEGQHGVFQVDVQTGEATTLKLLDGASFWNDWAPDGKTVYYRVDYGAESQIVALDLATGGERVLRRAQQPTWIVMIYVDVSPDGQHLAFWELEMDRAHARLLVIPTAGTEVNVLAREVLSVDYEGQRYPSMSSVQWTRDGRYLLYAVWDYESESGRLWRVSVAGGDPEPTELVLEGEFPQFHPDGRRIAFDYGESAWEIWVMQNYLPKE
jgi:Tol biopolymer transport system component